jgi:hypothetical protein
MGPPLQGHPSNGLCENSTFELFIILERDVALDLAGMFVDADLRKSVVGVFFKIVNT